MANKIKYIVISIFIITILIVLVSQIDCQSEYEVVETFYAENLKHEFEPVGNKYFLMGELKISNKNCFYKTQKTDTLLLIDKNNKILDKCLIKISNKNTFFTNFYFKKHIYDSSKFWSIKGRIYHNRENNALLNLKIDSVLNNYSLAIFDCDKKKYKKIKIITPFH